MKSRSFSTLLFLTTAVIMHVSCLAMEDAAHKRAYEQVEQLVNEQYGNYEGDEKFVALFNNAKETIGIEGKNIFLRCNNSLANHRWNPFDFVAYTYETRKKFFCAIVYDALWLNCMRHTDKEILFCFAHKLVHVKNKHQAEKPYERKLEEKEADAEAAIQLNCARNGINFLRQLDQAKKVAKEYSKTPLPDEDSSLLNQRIQWLEEIANQQNEPQISQPISMLSLEVRLHQYINAQKQNH